MSNYWDTRFLKHLVRDNIKTIVEVGARYGDESIMMSKHFPDANIYSFECNPKTIKKCQENLKSWKNIKFFNIALGKKVEEKPFYSYISDNDGASSFLYRIDGKETMNETGVLKIDTLNNVMEKNNIDNIDLLLLDTQGSELDIIKGLEKHIDNVKYIIAEIPKQVPNPYYLPYNTHSKYINAPTYKEIIDYLKENNFKMAQNIQENLIEDNILFSRY